MIGERLNKNKKGFIDRKDKRNKRNDRIFIENKEH